MTNEINEAVKRIAERWKSRRWPEIGYFVHGQAYSDIHELLGTVAQQAAIIEQQREALKLARDLMQAEATKMMYAMMNRTPLDYDIGLAKERLVKQVTAIDNVMKGV